MLEFIRDQHRPEDNPPLVSPSLLLIYFFLSRAYALLFMMGTTPVGQWYTIQAQPTFAATCAASHQ